MLKFEVRFQKRVSKLVEAKDRSQAVENALETINNSDPVKFEEADVDYIHEVDEGFVFYQIFEKVVEIRPFFYG